MTLGAAIPPKNYQGSASVSWNSPLFEADAMLWKPDDIALVKHRRDIRLIANTPERLLHARFVAPDCRPARNSRVSLVRSRHPTWQLSGLDRHAHAP
jgi:hypothetical protein